MSSNTQQDNTCTDCAPAAEIASQATTSTTSTAQHGESSSIVETIQPPHPDSLRPSILIEFCDRCRWAPRATWVQTELFLTFPVPIIKSITLQPLTSPETGGRFRVWIMTPEGVHLAWDRKTEGGFPELKILKQRIRNILQPELSLGHSDKPSNTQSAIAPTSNPLNPSS